MSSENCGMIINDYQYIFSFTEFLGLYKTFKVDEINSQVPLALKLVV